MELVSKIRQIGLILMFMLWLPFGCIFVGLVGEMGEAGRNFADFVDQYLPGLLSMRAGSQMPILSMVSLILTMAMMIGGLLLLFGAPMLAGWQNRRILRSGKPARAEVLAAENTGTSINNQPVVRFTLEVQPEGQTPFRAETERLVSYAQIGLLRPGAMVSVAYDPETLEVALRD